MSIFMTKVLESVWQCFQ